MRVKRLSGEGSKANVRASKKLVHFLVVIHINMLLQRRHGIFMCVAIMVMLGVNILIANTLREDTTSALGVSFLSFVFSFCGCI